MVQKRGIETSKLKKKKKFLNFRLYWFLIKFIRSNKIVRFIVELIALGFYKMFRSHKHFVFQDSKYPYFYHFYNGLAGERVVEIPVAKKLIDDYEGKKILEVGNVLQHYFPIKHKVLDKYEKGKKVINKDVVDFKFKEKFDLILSISTMEHVGFSYGEKKESGKFVKGINNLKKHLAKGGKLVVTFPLFFNPFIDELVKKRKTPFNKEYFMKRTSFWNEWEETDFEEVAKGNGYDKHYANSNILYIGIIDEYKK